MGLAGTFSEPCRGRRHFLTAFLPRSPSTDTRPAGQSGDPPTPPHPVLLPSLPLLQIKTLHLVASRHLLQREPKLAQEWLERRGTGTASLTPRRVKRTPSGADCGHRVPGTRWQPKGPPGGGVGKHPAGRRQPARGMNWAFEWYWGCGGRCVPQRQS